MGFIPEDTIAQVVDRSDIVSVISSYVPLRHAGRNFKANCPFHHEKTPSFIVNPEKQIFHCFGCGAGGNVISFVMQQEHLEFPEAVRLLAEKAGITIPEQGDRDAKAPQIKPQIKKLNALTAEYYHQNLLVDKSVAVTKAREYLQSRGMSLAMAKQFQLGFALEQWDGLLEFLKRRNVPIALIEKAGLIIAQSRTGGYYDRFRKRIIFPIFDSRGDCVAFGGRALPGEDEVKYLNSPETPAYTKGDHLYGFHWAKDAIGRSDEAVVVEGYLDFVTPFQAGVGNIVASLGTALTVEQVRLIRRYTHNIVMLYDADPAGQNAMLRSLDMLVDEGMTVRVATLTDGEDPDSFVRKFGGEKFQEQIKTADSLFDFKLKFLIQHHGDKSVEARAKVSSEMIPTISRFPSMVVQAEYVKRLAQTLFLSTDALHKEMSRVSKKEPAPRRTFAAVSADGAVPTRAAARPVEENLVRLMLDVPEFIPLTREAAGLEDFQDATLRQVVAKIFQLFDQGGPVRVPELMNCFTEPQVLNTISALVAAEEVLIGDKKKMHEECLQRLRQERLRSRRFIIRQAMEAARIQGDHLRLNELMHEFNQTIKPKG